MAKNEQSDIDPLVSLLPKAIIYPLIIICVGAAYFQYEYIYSWWSAGPGDTYRHEYLEGAFLIGMFSSIMWIGTLIFAYVKKDIFSKFDRTVAILSASSIGIGMIISVLIDMIF